MSGDPRWQEFTRLAGLGTLRPLDLAFAQFLAAQDTMASPEWLLVAALLSRQVADGHLCVNLQLTDALGEEQSWPQAWKTAVARITEQAAPRWLGSGEGETPLVLDGDRLYLRRYWEHECQVARAIAQRLDHDELPPTAIAPELTRLFATGMSPDWSRAACALATRSRFTVITGGPGTGKTTTVVRLLGLLQTLHLRDHPQPLRIRLAAPTGKAAARLTASIQAQLAQLNVTDAARHAIPATVDTLHRLLGARPDTRRFQFDAQRPLALDVLVIDEASMVDLEMMSAVLAALPPASRLILLGDKDQLSSVEAGAVLGDLCRRAERAHYAPATTQWLQQATGDDFSHWIEPDAQELDQHVTMLRHSHRFSADSGIGQLAQAVNAGDHRQVRTLLDAGLPDLRWFNRAVDTPSLRALVCPGDEANASEGYRHYLHTLHHTRPANDAGIAAFDAWARRVLAAFNRFQLLCAVRRGEGEDGAEGLNRRVAELLQREGLIDASTPWYEGRPVLVTRNDYQLGLMNGDVGMTLRTPSEDGSMKLRVAFVVAQSARESSLEVDRVRFVLPPRLGSLESVFAMTVHKSQGSEFEHAALVLPDAESGLLSRELLYTGITRAKSRFTLAGAADVVTKATGRQVSRHSGLADRLR